MSSRLTWYLNRFKTMNLPEIVFRGRQFTQRIYEKTFPKTPVYDSVTVARVDLPVDYSIFKNKLSGHFSIFGKELTINEQLDFHLDIFSGIRFPLAFSKTINTRSDEFGSAKVVWEVNRLQFLLPLLLNYRANGDQRSLDLFVSLMKTWQRQNPFMQGVNWYSNIEVNIRLTNWYWCWIVLENDEAWTSGSQYQEFRDQVWLPLIYQHCVYSHRNPSLYSSANNHLISEYAGLFVASTQWQFPESGRWLKHSQRGLEKEIFRQYSDRGVNKEEAAEYIQFITDFFLLPYVSGLHHQVLFSEAFTNQLIAIASYINDFLDLRHNFPKYGDEDDGKVIIADGDSHANNFLSILNSVAVLFNKPAFKRKGTEWDVKSHLLTAHTRGAATWDHFPFAAPPSQSVFYEKEGHLIFRNSPGKGKEVYAHFDAAPLGYLSIAAHGHADALSVFVNIDGYPFLVDPGTFTYHTHKEWRKYFVSTLAHNTITINHRDQATLAGPTLWVDHYQVQLLEAVTGARLDTASASHNGYQKQGFEHIRKIEFDKTENKFTITDVIASRRKEPCQISMPFHLHPEIVGSHNGPNSYQFSRPETSSKLQLMFDPRLTTKLTVATDDKPLGWYSPSFMKKEKSSLIMGEYLLEAEQISLTTIIKVIF